MFPLPEGVPEQWNHDRTALRLKALPAALVQSEYKRHVFRLEPFPSVAMAAAVSLLSH